PPAPEVSPMQLQTLVRERRRFERHVCDLNVTCTPCTNGSEVHWPGRVLDLSLCGTRLVVGRRFEVGTLLRILFRDDAGQPLASMLGRVIYLKPQGEGQWFLGCMIVPQLTEDLLETLLHG